MWWFLWGLILPACFTTLYVILRYTFEGMRKPLSQGAAREQFHKNREWLEAEFLTRLARLSPSQRSTWEDAHWHDEIVWARDRFSGELLALVEVHFDPEKNPKNAGRSHHATVVFKHAAGRWQPNPNFLDHLNPHEAVLRDRQLEPLVTPPRKPTH